MPIRAPSTRLAISAGQNGHPQLMTRRANSDAPGRPMLPTAKLMTLVER